MAKKKIPTDLHEWVRFEDDTEQRTWVFDVTFLTSPWTCIFGAGCQGVLTGPAEELVQGCCSYGAHFIDEDDVARVEAAARALTKGDWQFRAEGRKGGITEVRDGATTTRLVDDACIFLNRPGFAGGPGCALHQSAARRGVSYVALKPEVCWQLPLRRDESVDEEGWVTTTIGQWDRRHWGEGGQEFHWWCTEDAAAFVGAAPVYETMAEELTEMVGKGTYERLCAYLTRRGATPLPHPVLRAAQSS